jgi:phosphate starvation-inducible PhoH-like protein
MNRQQLLETIASVSHARTAPASRGVVFDAREDDGDGRNDRNGDAFGSRRRGKGDRPRGDAGMGASGGGGGGMEVYLRSKQVRAMTPGQQRYLEAMHEHDLTFCIGPAGTGKTYLAVAAAAAMLRRGEVRKLVLVRPAVEAGEKLGFLPGDLAEKVNPYLRPLYDALYDMIETEKATRLLERGTIEVAPIAFMRGRTLNDAFVILDEAQNTTSEQMKMFLTRLGFGSKAVVTGDITQIDLPNPRASGLIEALKVVKDIEGIGVVFFDDKDVVRHKLVQQIVKAYDAYSGPRSGDANP